MEGLAKQAKHSRDSSIAMSASPDPSSTSKIKPVPPAPPKPVVRKPARRARLRRRHVALFLSFQFMVLAPALFSAAYLYLHAAPQFASSMSLTIRSEEFRNPLDALSGLGQISTGTTSDAEVVHEFIGSQKIVREIDAKLNLRALFSKPEGDPVFTLDPEASVEALTRHWQWMVQADLDRGSGLIRVKTFAFSAEDGQAINEEILAQSQKLVDRLSFLAREDATKYATADLEEARERLKKARADLSEFRAESQIIDPTIDLQSQGGVSAALQQQLAEALIQLDLLVGSTTRNDDPRIEQAERRISAIRDRLATERQILAPGANEGMVSVVGQYEALTVEREFAEQAFLSAAAALDSARAEAKRRTKYLAVHIEPTLADTALYPRSVLIVSVIAALSFLIWAVFIMVAYSVRDRR